MLKKLHIQNFEAHKDTTITFGPGLNVIHGRSNNGKSASLRAIELAAYGAWAAGENKKEGINGPVRIGSKSCEIEIESNKGNVKVKRGKSINEWDILNKETSESFNLQNPGAGPVEQAQDILGLRSIEIAGTQIRFNWSDQRDKHFLIEEVEGKNSSPSFVAGILDEVGGLSGCEDLVRKLAQDKSTYEKSMKEAYEKRQETEDSLKKFENLDDEIEDFQKTEEILNKAEELKNISFKINSIKTQIEKIKFELTKYKSLESEIEKTKYLLDKISNTEKKIDISQKASKISISISKKTEQNKNIDKEIKKIQSLDINSISKKREKSEELKRKAVEIRKLLSKITNLQNKIQEIKNTFDFRKIAVNVAKVEKTISLLEKIIVFSNNIQTIFEKNLEAQKQLDQSQNKKNDAKSVFEEIVEEINLCPTCGQEITEECKKELKEGV